MTTFNDRAREILTIMAAGIRLAQKSDDPIHNQTLAKDKALAELNKLHEEESAREFEGITGLDYKAVRNRLNPTEEVKS